MSHGAHTHNASPESRTGSCNSSPWKTEKRWRFMILPPSATPGPQTVLPLDRALHSIAPHSCVSKGKVPAVSTVCCIDEILYKKACQFGLASFHITRFEVGWGRGGVLTNTTRREGPPRWGSPCSRYSDSVGYTCILMDVLSLPTHTCMQTHIRTYRHARNTQHTTHTGNT